MENRHELYRQGWQRRFNIDYPEDLALGVAGGNAADVPEKYLQLYARFLELGWIFEHGTHCVFMAYLLRRIMRLHKIDAHVQQMVCYWRNDRKQQSLGLGLPYEAHQITQDKQGIDAHMVVKSDGWILDFSTSPIHLSYGMLGPRGIIVPDTDYSKHYCDLGLGGKVSYVPVTPQNPIVKHWRLDLHQDEIEKTKEYFKRYAF